uniref:Uncharacterized protein n=2 Tax=Avena sativa TaxID=4498 RepID=A0ACD6AK04_AVESA
MDPDSEISFDFSPFLCQYKSGRVVRHGSNATVPAGTDPLTGVVSKDIHVGAARARVYLPPGTAESPAKAKLPVIIYFHGGGFVVGSPADPSEHAYLNDLAARAGAIGVSVYYRLAPEHPLPAAYEDCWAAVRWAATRADPWLLDHADLSRVFLAGCSAGANLAHNMAVRASAASALPDGVTVRGLLAVHPYFNGTEAVGAEAASLGPEVREHMDRAWRFVCPGSVGLDDPLVNPFADDDDDARAAVARIPCERVLVCAAEHDSRLKERALWYYRELKASGYAGEVDLFESKGVGHAFHLGKLHSEEGVELQQRTVAFIRK